MKKGVFIQIQNTIVSSNAFSFGKLYEHFCP